MKTGFRGTFAISWTQTEVDGLAAPPATAIGVGAAWRWHGAALRLDGPGDVLRLEDPAGEAEFHIHAARMARRLVGAVAPGGRGSRRAGPVLPFDDPLFSQAFDVTDGRETFPVAVVDRGQGAPLVIFAGALPPADTDLWVVRSDLGNRRASPAAANVICFTPGTRIRTAKGDVAVEAIREGTKVQTKDNGLREVLWIGSKRISGAGLYAMPELRPIRLRRGALGVDRPDGDLVVSPGHRLLVRGRRAQALYNADEVLVCAADLVNDSSVVRDHSLAEVTYIHLMLEAHEVVFANGLEAESFLPEAGMATLDGEARGRLIRTMPDLAADPALYGAPARRLLGKAEAAILMGG